LKFEARNFRKYLESVSGVLARLSVGSRSCENINQSMNQVNQFIQ